MRFEIGDRVVINSEVGPDDHHAVGPDNIGTIIQVYDNHCDVNWDLKGPGTYCIDKRYPHQWNVPYYIIDLADENYLADKEHPNYNVIRKVIRMNKTRKEKGYAF